MGDLCVRPRHECWSVWGVWGVWGGYLSTLSSLIWNIGHCPLTDPHHCPNHPDNLAFHRLFIYSALMMRSAGRD